VSRFRDLLREQAEEDGEVPNVVEKVEPGKKKLKKKVKKKTEDKVNVELAPPVEEDEVAPADGAHFKEAILADQKGRALELGVEFLDTEEELIALKEKIGKIAKELFPLVKALGGTEEEITTTGGGRRATMAGIIEKWGDDGKKWWNKLKPAKGYERLEGRGPRSDKKTSRSKP
jgi:hypothetical protein